MNVIHEHDHSKRHALPLSRTKHKSLLKPLDKAQKGNSVLDSKRIDIVEGFSQTCFTMKKVIAYAGNPDVLRRDEVPDPVGSKHQDVPATQSNSRRHEQFKTRFLATNFQTTSGIFSVHFQLVSVCCVVLCCVVFLRGEDFLLRGEKKLSQEKNILHKSSHC